MDSSLQHFIEDSLSSTLGTSVQVKKLTALGGGSINHTYRLDTVSEKFFCKVNSADDFPAMFRKEQHGLELLAGAKCIRVPRVIGNYFDRSRQVLVLEWIEQGIRTESFWKTFGEQLAALHSNHATSAGLDDDNYMGSLVQLNNWLDKWVDFFINYRLKPQVRLAQQNDLLTDRHISLFENLYTKLPSVFPPQPFSLLHGDLWSGNFICDDQSKPVLIDPAVYYGYSCIDLAMTTMFGGFDKMFYSAYHSVNPFPSNHREQWAVCNLYPLLIHLNLFGKGYLPEIISTLQYY